MARLSKPRPCGGCGCIIPAKTEYVRAFPDSKFDGRILCPYCTSLIREKDQCFVDGAEESTFGDFSDISVFFLRSFCECCNNFLHCEQVQYLKLYKVGRPLLTLVEPIESLREEVILNEDVDDNIYPFYVQGSHNRDDAGRIRRWKDSHRNPDPAWMHLSSLWR